jgi:hypothetical protein
MVHLLRGYCNKHPKLWDEQFPYVQHAYNHAMHSSTQRTPFEVCLGYFPKSPMDFSFGEASKEDGQDDTDKVERFIQRIQQVHQAVQEQLEKSQAKYKARHDKHQVDHQFQVGDQVWLHINKDIMKGEGKNLRPIRYGPFKILENIGTNAFHLDLPSYMQMYSVVNVENLKLYEPPMIMDEDESIQVPTVDDFSPEYLDELQEDVILDRRIKLHSEVMWNIFELVLKG